MAAVNEDDVAASTTTRVCIKNVPLSFTDTKLREFLLEKCSIPLTITDCHLLKTPKGKSRRLAFCGFSSVKMAQQVLVEFDKTYCLTSKLKVEPAFSKKSAPTEHRPWSQYSVGSSRYQAKHGDTQKEASPKEEKQTTVKDSKEMDQKKQEFLAAMGATTTKTKFWANDDVAPVHQEQQEEAAVEESESSESDSSDDDSVDSGGEGADVLKTAAVRQRHGAVVSDMDFLRSKVTAKENLSDSDDDDSSSSSSSEEEDDNETKVAETKATVPDAVDTSDDSSSDSSVPSSDDDDEEQEHHHDITANDKQDDKKSEGTTQQEHEDPNRLFVRNLPFTTTEEELLEHMSSFGTVVSCHIAVDDQKRNKGFAFVTFQQKECAQQARLELDGTDFQGRLIHILPAKREKDRAAPTIPDDDTLTYKQKQEVARQQQALASAKGWSASFVRGDAVVDNLADRLGLHKGDILNVKDDLSSGDAAVRLALGETHIIEENRLYFRKEGIDMDALVSVKGDTSKRSNCAMLVKNLPYDTQLEELTKVFHGAGSTPQRILLPPSRTIALVEYGHATDARRAFRKLAYKRFKHVPLYLEWAPLAATIESAKANESTQDTTSATSAKDNDAPVEEEETGEPSVSHTIYVKNLNFSTSEHDLMRVFQKHVNVRAVKIPTKTAPVKKVRGGGTVADEVKTLSMGFGFVECDSEESVRKAIKALQSIVVDGHALELKRSSKAVAAPKRTSVTKGVNPTKLMVRNVPFQATRKELLQLFGSYGQLKKVRLPKKFDGTHRGFAFVEYLTGQEAQTAMNALSSTHLYGRHLVLEWASDKDDMDTLREKAKRDIDHQPSAPKNKKIRFE